MKTIKEIFNAIAAHLASLGILSAGAIFLGFANKNVPLWTLFIALFGGLIIGYLTSYLIAKKKKPTILKGESLSQSRFYPIDIKNNALELNLKTFTEAIEQYKTSTQTKAAYELCYLGQAIDIRSKLSSNEALKNWDELYKKNVQNLKHDPILLTNHLFQLLSNIIDGLGKTINSESIEFVLHDIRNPLHSIISISNPITGRKVGDPLTEFGIDLIREYDAGRLVKNEVNYKVSNREIKGATIPLRTEELGLFGFICINVDIIKLNSQKLIEDITYINPENKVNEIIK